MATTTETTTATESFSAPPFSKQKTTEQALTGGFQWNDLIVPEYAGRGATKRQVQTRTLIVWATTAALSLYIWYTSKSPSLRAAALGLVFPGAGLFAVGTIPSFTAFVLTEVSIPLVLFAWFGAGGLAFPLTLWTGSILLSAFLARDSLWEISAPLWTAICLGGIGWIAYQTQTANAAAQEKRKQRNEYVISSVQKTQQEGHKHAYGSRELSLRDLRFVQWFIELGLRPLDDFTYHDVIDQFQTAAIRYQLYDAVSDVALYQFLYAPNFHGYASEAMRRCIEKSLTERVVGFWKYESSWGKFKFSDWDPIKDDDIMVSGYVLQAVGIYQSNTGDDRYTKPGSLVFEVSPKHKYPYDFKKLAEECVRQWDASKYCLFSCEPNWIYTMCNLTGTSGLTLASRLFKADWAEKLKKRFEKALLEDFCQQDGTVMTIRSEMTGFTIPGLAGRLSDGINSLLCAAFLPHVAHRCWAFVKKESVEWQADGSIKLLNLEGADKLDPGNYKPSEGFTRAVFAAAAAEYGDIKIRDQLVKELDELYHPVFETSTKALKNKRLSVIGQGQTLKARIGGYQDWCDMITKGPPENVFRGPLLDEVAFPDVLVAKAYSPDGESLDLVLYPGKADGRFDLGFARLRPGEPYRLEGADEKTTSCTADKDGKAKFVAQMKGRTVLKLVRGS